MPKGKNKELDDRLPTTMISKRQLGEVREAAYQCRISIGRLVREALVAYLLKLKKTA